MVSETSDVRNYKGNMEVDHLIPHIGTSYKEQPRFKQIVQDLNKRQYKTALDQLDENISKGIDVIDSLSLKGEVLAIFELNQQTVHTFKAVLQYDPKNVYAISMICVQLIILKTDPTVLSIYFNKLKEASQKVHDRLRKILTFIEEHKYSVDFKESDAVFDLLCVYGYSLNADGTVPLILETRLRKTLELAKGNPGAKILLSGGSVHNEHSEARVMKEYLLDAGIDENRLVPLENAKDTVGNVLEFMPYIETGHYKHICAVTSYSHLPRAWMTLYVAVNKSGCDVKVGGSAYKEQVSSETWKQEHQLNYQTVLRAAGLFTKEDIKKVERS